jgi:hypothetical protein
VSHSTFDHFVNVSELLIYFSMSAAAKRWRYLRRLIFFRQMDFEFAFWQMYYLMTAPQQVYRNFNYRKKTKLQVITALFSGFNSENRSLFD